MNDWEILRRQVAIGGSTSDDAGVALAGVRVAVMWAADRSVQAACDSRYDGSYFFLDLPDGAYVVLADLGKRHAEADATVKRDEQQSITMARVNLRLDAGGV